MSTTRGWHKVLLAGPHPTFPSIEMLEKAFSGKKMDLELRDSGTLIWSTQVKDSIWPRVLEGYSFKVEHAPEFEKEHLVFRFALKNVGKMVKVTSLDLLVREDGKEYRIRREFGPFLVWQHDILSFNWRVGA